MPKASQVHGAMLCFPWWIVVGWSTDAGPMHAKTLPVIARMGSQMPQAIGKILFLIAFGMLWDTSKIRIPSQECYCYRWYLSCTNRYKYPATSDDKSKWTINYHPGVLLYFKSHNHLQRTTQAAWVYYIMKYCFKCEPHGNVNITPDTSHAFGLPEEVSNGTLQVVWHFWHAWLSPFALHVLHSHNITVAER